MKLEKDETIFVAGHRGMVGSAIQQRLLKSGFTNVIGRSRSELDLLDRGAVREAARTSDELHKMGLGNQLLVVNGVFHASVAGDAVADGLERDHAAVLQFRRGAQGSAPA